MTSFTDHMKAERIAKIAVRHAARKLRRLDFIGEAKRLELTSADDVRRYTEAIERKGLQAVYTWGIRKAIRELSNDCRLIHLQAEMAYRLKRGERVPA